MTSPAMAPWGDKGTTHRFCHIIKNLASSMWSDNDNSKRSCQTRTLLPSLHSSKYGDDQEGTLQSLERPLERGVSQGRHPWCWEKEKSPNLCSSHLCTSTFHYESQGRCRSGRAIPNMCHTLRDNPSSRRYEEDNACHKVAHPKAIQTQRTSREVLSPALQRGYRMFKNQNYTARLMNRRDTVTDGYRI